MRKKFWWVGVFILSLSLLVAGCGGGGDKAASKDKQDAAAAGTLDQIKQKGELVVGLDDNFPPMGYRDESNKLVGFDIDMGDELSKRLGVKITWQPTEWDGVMMSLNSKKFDVIISGMTVTDLRKKEIDFSIPYVNDGVVMVVKKGTTGFNTAEDLKGKVVGTQMGSSGEESAKKIEGLKDVKLYKQYPEAFSDLQIGRIPVVVADKVTAQYFISKRSDTFEIVGEQLTKEPMAIGIRKADTDVKEAIDKALTDMQKDGTLTSISQKWFGADVTPKAE